MTSPVKLPVKVVEWTFCHLADERPKVYALFVSGLREEAALPVNVIVSVAAFPNVVFPFTPTNSHWEQQIVNINSYAGRSNVSLKFVFTGFGGNWLYIDNFVVCETGNLFLNEESFSELNIFPNPSKGDATIEFNLFKDSKIEITLSNLHGAILAQESMELKAKLNRIQLKELYASLKAGVYFIKISQNGISTIKKVVISE